jgi:hypothetical protein
MTNVPENCDGWHLRAGQSAVEAHGLAKRSGTRIAVDKVDLLRPGGLRVRLPPGRTGRARPR